MASIRDVAKEAGVSPATVSRTFTSPGLINEDTQKRVLDAARRLDYMPPRLRSSRVPTFRGKSYGPAPSPDGDIRRDAIGFQFFAADSSDSVFSNNFYSPVLAGAQDEAAALGLHVLVHTTDRHRVAQEIPRMILEQAVGGLLLVGAADRGALELFARHVSDIVLVDNLDNVEPFESVVSDGFGGAHAATRYLLGLGHRRIAFYLAEDDVNTFRERRRGWLCAMAEACIVPDPSLVIAAPSDGDRRERLVRLLQSDGGPTAILAANDQHAFILLDLCRELGIDVPGRVSVVGFDDVQFPGASFPSLTTVHVDKEFMGRLAVRRLYARLHTEAHRLAAIPDPVPVRHQVPTTLIVRGSSGPPTVSSH
ncbi:MAG TPA: LacI family DNA-binding transcriptional regulator [Armatimonadaceae bacterium]|nr:LacI family DNA-binding transcriptional regulator [Armatimonadaceae bacterium]